MKQYEITVNGKVYQVSVKEVEEDTIPLVQGTSQQQTEQSMPSPTQKQPVTEHGQTKIVAPMPGSVLQVRVSEGQKVQKGDVLCILEAMKMENEIIAPINGTISSIQITPNQAVNSGDLFMIIS